MFKLTVHFKHEMIGIWQRFQRNFKLTVFELTMPDLYNVILILEINLAEKNTKVNVTIDSEVKAI